MLGMGGKIPISKYLIVSIIILAVGVPTAYAITITLGGDPVIINGILDMMSNRITNVGTPTVPTDAATKAYVDSAPGTDTLALLGCTTDQIAKFDGAAWICTNNIDCKEPTVTLTESVTVPNSDCVLTKKSLTPSGNKGSNSELVIGVDNFPIMVFKSDIGLELIHCTSIDCSTFENPIQLDSNTIFQLGTRLAIAIGTDGFLTIAYSDEANTDLKFIHCTSVNCSSRDSIITLDGSNIGIEVSLAIGTDGLPVLSYKGGSNLVFIHCTTKNCSSSSSSNLETDIIGGNHMDMKIGSDGLPLIVYDGTNGDLTVIHCTSVNCSASESNVFLTPERIFPDSVSLAIGTDGFPVMAYVKNSGTELKVVHCTSVNCSTRDTSLVLDNIANLNAEEPSITIGTDNFPVIAYYHDGLFSKDLRFIHCTKIDCSSNDSPITIDTTGEVGIEPSVAIGVDDFPVISYRDTPNLDLKVAHCSDSKCLLR